MKIGSKLLLKQYYNTHYNFNKVYTISKYHPEAQLYTIDSDKYEYHWREEMIKDYFISLTEVRNQKLLQIEKSSNKYSKFI